MTCPRHVQTEQAAATELPGSEVRGGLDFASTADDERFWSALAALPEGYTMGRFQGKRWGTTKNTSVAGIRVWLFATELGGRDIVSFNAYRLTDGRLLVKPCEMSLAKVAGFVRAYKVERPE